MVHKSRENPGGYNVIASNEGAQTTSEARSEAHERPKAERYQAEHIQLITETEGSSVAALQRALNKGARQSWSLVGISRDPAGQGVLLIWDTPGFISG